MALLRSTKRHPRFAHCASSIVFCSLLPLTHHQGHLHVVQFLISAGASAVVADHKGTSSLCGIAFPCLSWQHNAIWIWCVGRSPADVSSSLQITNALREAN
jgi:hypothetical protein